MNQISVFDKSAADDVIPAAIVEPTDELDMLEGDEVEGEAGAGDEAGDADEDEG